tara:strand:+ start:2012 stop:2593 length:582 start_codon:yes stop_codon:yes gene_type:complete
MKLVFATQNSNKVKEIQNLLPESIQLLSLADLDYFDELEETQQTLEGNALQKARFVSERFKIPCFADDTGLEIRALDGAPGVYSARYAGEEKSFEKNMDKVLFKLNSNEQREAQFRTAIALILNGEEFLFEGLCIGEILKEKRGNEGFGYDPIFMPKGYDLSFGEMTLEQKNEIGHRGKAVKKLVNFLKEYSK